MLRDDHITDTYLIYQNALRRYISGFHASREDIEDTLQDAYLKAFSASKDSTIRCPKAYLFRVARNVALNRKKAQKKRFIENVGEFDESIALDDKATVEDVVYSKEQFRIFGDAVSSLPPQCRRVFLMQRIWGYSYKDIAKKLGISERTVENHLAKALLRCREYMRGTGYSVNQADV